MPKDKVKRRNNPLPVLNDPRSRGNLSIYDKDDEAKA